MISALIRLIPLLAWLIDAIREEHPDATPTEIAAIMSTIGWEALLPGGRDNPLLEHVGDGIMLYKALALLTMPGDGGVDPELTVMAPVMRGAEPQRVEDDAEPGPSPQDHAPVSSAADDQPGRWRG